MSSLSQADYPFDITNLIDSDPSLPVLTLGKTTIAAQGSLSPIESDLLLNFWEKHDIDQTPARDVWAAMAHILLVCRVDPRITLEQTRRLPAHRLEEAFDFVMNEQRRWKQAEAAPDAEDESAEKKDEPTGQISTGDCS